MPFHTLRTSDEYIDTLRDRPLCSGWIELAVATFCFLGPNALLFKNFCCSIWKSRYNIVHYLDLNTIPFLKSYCDYGCVKYCAIGPGSGPVSRKSKLLVSDSQLSAKRVVWDGPVSYWFLSRIAWSYNHMSCSLWEVHRRECLWRVCGESIYSDRNQPCECDSFLNKISTKNATQYNSTQTDNNTNLHFLTNKWINQSEQSNIYWSC